MSYALLKLWIQDLSQQLSRAFVLLSFSLVAFNDEYLKAILIQPASFVKKPNRY